ncbi:N-acetylmuramoyl-L-alanine amidase family protein [Oceanivirga salmonicida]|uniref:N-acetylmuramoyl-L-alanine amidase family protein n=1 Tax=Oceanivirga salmonicida TaxID=1769291 RepID=UPI0012E26EF7|nr:N-acetylmuramoyl-L-alanine amidase [Oceanivirga salmonicida]
MIKELKKIIFLLFCIIPIITFSNDLESVSYRNGQISLTFSERVPRYKEVFDSELPSLTLLFEDTDKNKRIEQVISVNDSYLMDILTENYNGETDIVIYLQSRVKYTISSSGKKLIIKLKEESVLVKKKKTIVLDAGHGGKDSGAVGNGYREKDIALKVILELYRELSKDYNVILTRKDDTFIPLNRRADIGNENNADLFVSVHLNSSHNRKAHGAEVFYFSKNPSSYAKQLAKYENSFDIKGARAIEASQFVIEDVLYHLNQQQSAIVANSILDGIVRTMNMERRRVAGANFAVLRGSISPSILIELGFVSNHDDIKKYSTSYGQRKVAKTIAEAIRKHY